MKNRQDLKKLESIPGRVRSKQRHVAGERLTTLKYKFYLRVTEWVLHEVKKKGQGFFNQEKELVVF